MKKYGKYILSASIAAALCAAGVNVVKSAETADPAAALNVISVDYDNLAVVLRGSDDTKYYISDGNQKKWEQITATTVNNTKLIDISWISNMRTYDLSIKGDVSAKPIKLKIPKCDTRFRVAYDANTGNITYSGLPVGYTGDVQWRVKGYTQWNTTTANPEDDKELIENLTYYLNTDNATTIYFRVAPEAGKSESDPGTRPGREVSIVLPKLAPMPAITVNADNTVTVPKQVKYKVVGSDTWSFANTADQNVSVNTLAPNAFITSGNPTPTDQIVEFRTDASSNVSQLSESAYIKVKAQRSAGAAVTVENISYSGTGTRTVKKGVKTSINTALKTAPATSSALTEPAPVTVLDTNYDTKQIRLQLNGNGMAFYSTDKTNWHFAGDKSDINDCVLMDIGWMNENQDYTLYFKGDSSMSESYYTTMTIPKKVLGVRAAFDRTSTGDAPKVTLTGTSASQLQWRKKDCYVWNTVSAGSAGEFISTTFEDMRTKGGRIIVRTAPTNGSGASNSGIRPSNEYSLVVPKRSAAPSVRINPVTMTVNTSAAMEYYDTVAKKWTDCTKSMSVWDFPAVNSTVKATVSMSGSDVSVEIRKKATSTNGYSKPTTLVFAGQRSAPSIGQLETNNVRYSSEIKTVGGVKNTYHTLRFKDASAENVYQYILISKSASINENRAAWITVNKPTTITLTGKKAVSGSKVYVRLKGATANAKKQTNAILPSVSNSFDIP